MLRHSRVLRYVDEVARLGSIRRAAERLNVAPSAVQRRIGDIEADLGVSLFERTRTGMRPTAAGEAFLAWVRGQAAGFERLRSQIEDMQGLQSGTIRLACSQAVVAGMMSAEIAAFTTRYPNVGFQVVVQSHLAAFAALDAYDVDLALVFLASVARPAMDGVGVLGAMPQRLFAVVGKSHPLAARTSVRLRDCVECRMALPDRSFGSRQSIDAALHAAGQRAELGLESNSFEMLRRYVRVTPGAVTFQIEAGVTAEDGLVGIPVDDRDGCGGHLVLAQMKGRALPVAASAFARQVTGRLDQG